ncbi:TolC family protein [Serratia quinivorans]|uniref:TolC family protein n=1 Tax=Serratia quinivorans TaxID=137545 RepID=UPI003F9AF16C
MKILSLLAVCLIPLLSAGCGNALKSEYYPPKVDYPADWQQNAETDVSEPFNWRDFRDPQLDRWLQQVMAANNDLAAAALRVYRAQLAAQRVDIGAAPNVSATLNSGGNAALSDSSPWNNSSSANLGVSYEVDLWGKLARQRDAAEWASQATQQDLQSARLALFASASKNYWRIGFINQRINVSQQNIDYSRKTLELVKARYHAGSVSALDVVDAEQNLVNQESSHLALLRERQQALNEQTVLLGAPPGSSLVEPNRLPTGPLPQINADIPASVLHHRPDISAKELRLREALANVDIKRTQYYPAFSLTGSLGTSSTALLEFLRNPLASVGAGLSLPFLEWRQMNVDIKIARSDYELQVLEFKQSLYKAMADIDDALSLRTQLMAQEKHMQAALALARKSERLNESRYRHGSVPINFWLDAQNRRRLAELALDENRFAQYQNLAQLYLEFGGAA